jgi:hypothetical protein
MLLNVATMECEPIVCSDGAYLYDRSRCSYSMKALKTEEKFVCPIGRFLTDFNARKPSLSARTICPANTFMTNAPLTSNPPESLACPADSYLSMCAENQYLAQIEYSAPVSEKASECPANNYLGVAIYTIPKKELTTLEEAKNDECPDDLGCPAGMYLTASEVAPPPVSLPQCLPGEYSPYIPYSSLNEDSSGMCSAGTWNLYQK